VKPDNETEAPEPPKGGFFSPAKSQAERVSDAIEQWYAAHFHAAATSGRPPITSDEKAALVEAVTAAINEE
jgi:hypothetical protein